MDPGSIESSQGINIFQIEGQTYIAIPKDSILVDELGISPVTDIDVTAPSPGAPILEHSDYILVDIDTFMDVGMSSGALEGVSAEGINLETFALAVQNKLHEIIIKMLDKWSERLEEDAKRVREEAIQDAKKSTYERVRELQDTPEYKAQLTETKIAGVSTDMTVTPAEKMRIREDLRTGQINAMHNYKDRVEAGQATQVAFVMGSLAIGATFMADFVQMGVAGSVEASTPAINVALQTVQQVGGAEIGQNLAALGYLGALFMVGANVAVNAEKVGGVKGNPAEANLKTAQAYAEKMLKSLKNDSDVSYLLNAVGEGKQDLIAMTKITMAALPLALLYRMEAGPAGRITSEEFAALIKGEIDDITSDSVKGQLIQVMQEQLSILREADPKMAADLLERLMAYLDSNPKAEKLLDFAEVAKNIAAEAKNHELAA